MDPNPTVNLSVYTTYHYAVVCIRRDGRVEETEYFHLRFDEENLPDRVFAENPKEIRFEIYDTFIGRSLPSISLTYHTGSLWSWYLLRNLRFYNFFSSWLIIPCPKLWCPLFVAIM